MKKVFFLLAVGIMISVNLFAQDPGQEFIDRMNHIFQYVDKSRITTGLLSDYGLQMVEPEYFNGVLADSNYVDYGYLADVVCGYVHFEIQQQLII